MYRGIVTMGFASGEGSEMGRKHFAHHLSTPWDGRGSVPGTPLSLSESAPRFCLCDVAEVAAVATGGPSETDRPSRIRSGSGQFPLPLCRADTLLLSALVAVA